MCDIKHCRKEAELVFYGYDICEFHWQEQCKGSINLMQIFNIPEEVIA